MGYHFLLQRTFPTQGLDPGLTVLQTDSLPSEPPGKPIPHLSGDQLRIKAHQGPINTRGSQEFQQKGHSVQSLSHIRLFVTPWTAAHQASLSIANSRSLLKLMSIELVMPSNHLILCHPLLLLTSIFPGIRVFSNELVLCIRCPKYWTFSFSISPSNEYSGLISFRISLQSKGLSRVFSNTTVQKHQFFGAQLSSQSNSHIHT